MNEVLLGNICSLGAMISESVSSTREKRNEILGIQIISQFFYAAASVILKGYSSTAQNVAAVLRNLAAMKNVRSRFVEWFLIALGVILGLILNNRGLLGLVPILTNLEYSMAIFYFKTNERGLKWAFFINKIFYSIFSLSIMDYVGGISNIVTAVTTLISLFRTGKKAGM